MSPIRLNDKQFQTLQAVFEAPARSDIAWSCLSDLFVGLGAVVKVNGDRICLVIKSGSRTTCAVLHQRNQDKYASTHAISSIQKFFDTARVKVAK